MNWLHRTIIVLVAFGVFSVLNANAQCVSTPADPCVTVNQSLLDRSAAAVRELVEARVVIQKMTAERVLAEAERNAAQALIRSLNDVLDVRGRIITEYERMMTLYKSVIDMQQQIIEKALAQANKKSGWQKFLEILKTVASIAVGIAIGRGF